MGIDTRYLLCQTIRDKSQQYVQWGDRRMGIDTRYVLCQTIRDKSQQKRGGQEAGRDRYLVMYSVILNKIQKRYDKWMKMTVYLPKIPAQILENLSLVQIKEAKRRYITSTSCTNHSKPCFLIDTQTPDTFTDTKLEIGSQILGLY